MAEKKLKRKESEALVYEVMDALDPSGTNSEFYKNLFAGMSDEAWLKFISRDFPYRFQTRLFKIEPSMTEIKKALKILNVPMIEKLNLPYLYRNSDGVAVEAREAMVIYLNVKKMKQFVTKKNSIHTDMSKRDMKTGRLISESKGGQTSDREFEALAVHGLDATMMELARPKADAIRAKNIMYNDINTLGDVDDDDIVLEKDDSMAKNLMSVYLIGSQLGCQLVDEDYMVPHTYKNKTRRVEREV